jgi:hypothetical protein
LSDRLDMAQLAGTLALRCVGVDEGLRFGRHGYEVLVPEPIGDHLVPESALGRHLLYGILWGIRLAIDRANSDYEPAHERPERPERVFLPHEIPSVYGERLPRVATALTLAWFTQLSAEQPVKTGGLVDGLDFVYILETGMHLHVLCDSDLGALELSRERLVRDARHALFYNSYKLKPQTETREDWGRVRVFRSSEGLGAGRAMLLPDFDYDAARTGGCVSTPSRDVMVIGRPASPDQADEVYERVAQTTRELLDREAFPLSSFVHRLSTDAIGAGESVSQAPLPPEHLEAVLPPSDLQLDAV